MKRPLAWKISLFLLAVVLVGCGHTPEPTAPGPTQTPWIIVITATAQPQPTQTPWIIVATPTPAARASARATRGLTRPTPTHTPDAASLEYPAPVLRDPPDAMSISWDTAVRLEWSDVGPLAEDEYYHLHLDAYRQANEAHWYGDYVFTKDTTYLAEGAFLAPFHPPADQGRATVYWSVGVVRKTGEDEQGKPLGIEIGLPSEKRSFIAEPKPKD